MAIKHTTNAIETNRRETAAQPVGVIVLQCLLEVNVITTELFFANRFFLQNFVFVVIHRSGVILVSKKNRRVRGFGDPLSFLR